MASIMRAAKNTMGGYTDTETKVRDATSNASWGPSGTQLRELANLTYNETDFFQIVDLLDKRLNDKGKNWRHVFKSLTVLHFLLQAGHDQVATHFKKNLYIIKTLKEFQYLEEDGQDRGTNVRAKAKEVTDLLLDDNRRDRARRGRREMTDREKGARPRSSTDPPRRSEEDGARPRAFSEPNAGSRPGDHDEMNKAMLLSQEEYERQQRELAKQRGDLLFDEQKTQLIDTDLSTQPSLAPAISYADLYAEQQRLQQEEWARQQQQQQMMEMQRQANEQAQYNSMMLQQQQYAQLQAMAQQEYAQQQAFQQQQYMIQQQQAVQPILPQATAMGANNPFAANATAHTHNPFAASTSSQPSASSYQEQLAPPSREYTPSPALSQPRSSSAIGSRRTPRDDGKHAELARMLAGGREDGVDTFGNYGNLRIPVGAQFAQRTGIY